MGIRPAAFHAHPVASDRRPETDNDPAPGHKGDAMSRRLRKFIGAGAMLAFVMVYAVCAMVTAEANAIRTAPGPAQAVIYAVLGLAWILPLLPLIAWREKPDRGPDA